MLAEAGADLNIKCNSVSGETPLQICCKLDQRLCGKVLIDCGAQPDVRDNFGNNATWWATSKQNNDIIRLLGLPAVKSATAEEFLKLAILRNKSFTLPSFNKKGKKEKGASGKGKGKKGKK